MSNYRHLKTSDMQLTYIQERILDMLLLLTEQDLRYRGAGEYNCITAFKGRSIAVLLGGTWSTARKRQVDELIKQGWVEKKSFTGTGWAYWLTMTGYGALRARVQHAAQHSIQMFHDESEYMNDMFEGGAF